jgi:hypothetical protein
MFNIFCFFVCFFFFHFYADHAGLFGVEAKSHQQQESEGFGAETEQTVNPGSAGCLAPKQAPCPTRGSRPKSKRSCPQETILFWQKQQQDKP